MSYKKVKCCGQSAAQVDSYRRNGVIRVAVEGVFVLHTKPAPPACKRYHHHPSGPLLTIRKGCDDEIQGCASPLPKVHSCRCNASKIPLQTRVGQHVLCNFQAKEPKSRKKLLSATLGGLGGKFYLQSNVTNLVTANAPKSFRTAKPCAIRRRGTSFCTPLKARTVSLKPVPSSPSSTYAFDKKSCRR